MSNVDKLKQINADASKLRAAWIEQNLYYSKTKYPNGDPAYDWAAARRQASGKSAPEACPSEEQLKSMWEARGLLNAKQIKPKATPLPRVKKSMPKKGKSIITISQKKKMSKPK